MSEDDRRVDPTTQIRDRTRTVQTPSLLQAGNEPVPDEVVRDLLVEEWLETEVLPRPLIYVPGGPDSPKQVNLGRDDMLIIRVSDLTEEFTGHRHEHVNLEVPLTIEIRTVVNRQRAWNLMAEVRRIWYKWILALRPWHSLYFDRYVPEYESRHGYFGGTMFLRLTADAVPAFVRATEGMETPAGDPAVSNEV